MKRSRRRDRAFDEVKALDNAIPQEALSTIEEAPNARLREMAMIDFVTDPDQRSVEEHYARVDRPWRLRVSLTMFSAWANNGKWVSRRLEWWQQIEARILAKRAEQIANARLSEIATLESARSQMERYLFPLTNPDGSVKLHPAVVDGEPNPLAGLPMYGLRMPSLDKFIKTYIELDKQIMLKRGEATVREAALPPVNAHESSSEDQLSPEDLREMANALVRRRQPELAEQPAIVLTVGVAKVEEPE